MWTRNFRHALRVFRREPAFAAAAVLTLALGIGANTALFAVVEAVLLRPLPYGATEPVIIKHRDVRTGLAKFDVAIGDFIDLRARQRSFDLLGGYSAFQSTLTGEREPLRIEGASITPEVFGVLGVQPAMGRAFEVGDAQENAQPVVIVSYELWRTQLGSDPRVLSRSLQLGATRRMIVGVAPAGFRFPPAKHTDVLVPLSVPATAPAGRKSGWIYAIGRLKADVTLDRADAELATLSRQFEREFPQQNEGSLYYSETLRDALVGTTKRPLILLLIAVGFVLLIACANVGNLLLARSLTRRQDLALRIALGASRGRVVMETLAEGLVLALAGGLAGVAVAWRAAPALAALVPQSTPVPGLESVGINVWVLAFSLFASVASALIFSGIACVGLELRHDAGRTVFAGDRRTTMTAAARMATSSLVVAEIALAVVLLIGAGLTLRSFANLLSVDPGFTAHNVLVVEFALPAGSRYAEMTARRAFYDESFAALEDLPQVERAGAAMVTPLTGNNWTVPFERADQPVPSGQRPPDVGWQLASRGYFEALRIPLRAGRLFDARERAADTPGVIVSESIVTRFFPGESAVGKRIRLGTDAAEIVGVVGDIRRASLTDEPRADLYFPFERQSNGGITLFIRTSGDPLAALPAVRSAIGRIEPNAVMYDTRTLDDVAAESAAVAALAMRLLAGFAMVALALAAIGVYGVMSYSVRRRTRELGTRLALGAAPADIIRLVMGEASVTTIVGLVLGLAGGLAAARALAAMLYDVPPWDPAALAAASALLTVTALVASYLPARRAARVDPVSALAAE
jgi:putative ABC transport system permease protein